MIQAAREKAVKEAIKEGGIKLGDKEAIEKIRKSVPQVQAACIHLVQLLLILFSLIGGSSLDFASS